LIVLFACVSPLRAQALEVHDSRVNLLVHGNAQLEEKIGLHAVLILPNLSKGAFPVFYLGPRIKVASWLRIEPDMGWDFADDEATAGLVFLPSYKKFWAWGTFNADFPSNQGYWFLQLEYNFEKWEKLVSLGVEGEGWGVFGDYGWSNGGGPNITFYFKRLGVELTVHARYLDGEVGPEFQSRFLLFLGT